jgi:hypothetical protein
MVRCCAKQLEIWRPGKPSEKELRAVDSVSCYGRVSVRPCEAMMTYHIIKHELLRSKCGSFEVNSRMDGRPSSSYWDDVASRRLRPEIVTSEQALE